MLQYEIFYILTEGIHHVKHALHTKQTYYNLLVIICDYDTSKIQKFISVLDEKHQIYFNNTIATLYITPSGSSYSMN